MKMKLKTPFLFALLITAFLACKKNETKGPEPASSNRQNILKIAPTEEKFNEWTQFVVKHKVDQYNSYSVKKVDFVQIGDFRLSEVIIEIDGVTSNFFVATLWDFEKSPEINKYILRPITDIHTPSRTLLFASGKEGVAKMDISQGTYTIRTDAKSLFYLGVME